MFEKQNNEHQNVPELFLHSRSQKTKTRLRARHSASSQTSEFLCLLTPRKQLKSFWLPSQKKLTKTNTNALTWFPFVCCCYCCCCCCCCFCCCFLFVYLLQQNSKSSKDCMKNKNCSKRTYDCMFLLCLL